jgi:hypothetical protein
MEQLVHLRLKSIYKAFKQSSSGGRDPTLPLMPSSRIEELHDGEDDDMPDLIGGECALDDPQTLLQAAAAAAKSSSVAAAAHARHEHGAISKDNVASYKQEKEKADAAAAALLAELEDEENAVKTKKSKKKRKKQREKAKKEVDEPNDYGDDDDDDNCEKDHFIESDAEQDQKPAAEEESYASEDVGRETGGSPFDAPVENPQQRDAKVDPLEQKLCLLVADSDIEGLEELLASIKGVPGRAALRKNTKKAVKRLRTEEAGDDTMQESFHEHANDRSGAATPTAQSETSGITSDLLKVVSYTHNKPATQPTAAGNARLRGTSAPGKSECVLHMVPMIVGWVIGKGGQRIRDLMEESGARVWIDQDTMGAQDPRIVYVSGNRKDVEAAVQMIKELVLKAPTGTPQSKRNTPLVDVATSGKHVSVSGKPPLIPDSEILAPGSNVGLKPRGNTALSVPGAGDTGGKSKHVMSCDPRFVPLLIGRRGWTIKHIQDSSGARVDIDQTVTPRKITLSGSEDNVQIAIRMVRDVLSYPHSQLQGAVEGEHEAGVDIEGRIPVAPVGVQQTTPSPVQQSSPLDSSRGRPHSPPPSSLIMTGDAKSTISASSSLSSTPEASTSSSSRAQYQQVAAPGPVLPPTYGPVHGATSTNGIAANSFNRMQPPNQMPNAPIFPGNLGAPTQDSLFGQPRQTPGFLQGGVHSGQMGGPMIPQQHHGNPMVPPGNQIGRAPQSFPSRQDIQHFPHTPLQGFGPVPGGHPSQMPMQHQQSAFRPSQSGFPMSGPETQRSAMNNVVKTDNKGASGPGGMWGLPPSRAGPLPGQEGFRLDAAVEFLQHSQQPRTNSMPLSADGNNGFMGMLRPGENAPSGGMHREQSAPVLSPGRDESLMVDSLFAPAKNVRHDANLLTGLQGLSIENEGLGGGFWGSSTAGSNSGLEGAPPLPAVGGGGMQRSTLKEPSTLFSTAKPTPAANDHHPSQSRFAWGGH